MGTATIKGTTSGIDGADALVGIEVAWTTGSGALTIGNAPPATNRAVLTSEANTTGLTGLTAGIGKVFTGQDLTNFTTATGITFSTGSDTSDGNYYCYSRIWEKNGSTYQVSGWASGEIFFSSNYITINHTGNSTVTESLVFIGPVGLLTVTLIGGAGVIGGDNANGFGGYGASLTDGTNYVAAGGGGGICLYVPGDVGESRLGASGGRGGKIATVSVMAGHGYTSSNGFDTTSSVNGGYASNQNNPGNGGVISGSISVSGGNVFTAYTDGTGGRASTMVYSVSSNFYEAGVTYFTIVEEEDYREIFVYWRGSLVMYYYDEYYLGYSTTVDVGNLRLSQGAEISTGVYSIDVTIL